MAGKSNVKVMREMNRVVKIAKMKDGIRQLSSAYEARLACVEGELEQLKNMQKRWERSLLGRLHKWTTQTKEKNT